MQKIIFLLVSILISAILSFAFDMGDTQKKPVLVLNTWFVPHATKAAWDAITSSHKSSLDAIVAGCSAAEAEQSMGTVGFGGSPNEKGETTLDAMIMNGSSFEIGAVANLKRVKHAIAVAWSVMKYSKHTLLVGEDATQFALEMGFKEEDLHTNASIDMWKKWLANKCQPNFRQNVVPDPLHSCGPYKPANQISSEMSRMKIGISPNNHDTIGMIAIDETGIVAAGTSTNGARNKIPGRVGDSPIPGAGAYANSEVGAAASTGDGDIMMRFLPSFQTVENIRNGMDTTVAAEAALAKIVKYHPSFSGAIVATNTLGDIGAACHGFREFQFSFQKTGMHKMSTKNMTCS